MIYLTKYKDLAFYYSGYVVICYVQSRKTIIFLYKNNIAKKILVLIDATCKDIREDECEISLLCKEVVYINVIFFDIYEYVIIFSMSFTIKYKTDNFIYILRLQELIHHLLYKYILIIGNLLSFMYTVCLTIFCISFFIL